MRNKKDIEGAILFVTRTPCDECTSLIAMEGIKTVVVDEDVFSGDVIPVKKREGYEMFPEKVKKGKFVCFQTNKNTSDPKNIPAGEKSKKHILLEESDEGPSAKRPNLIKT